MAANSIAKRCAGRNHGLDLVKWIAVVTMVLDHLRLVWPELEVTFIPGRISFPFFCLAIAANVARGVQGQLIIRSHCRYVALMVLFSLISEVPYRYFYDSETLNVFPSLTLGVVVALGLYHRTLLGLIAAFAGLIVAAVFQKTLMYGFYGVLLPSAFTLAIKKSNASLLGLIPAVLCVVLNSRHGALGRALEMNGFAMASLLTAFCSAIVGLQMLRLPLRLNLIPVGHWAYWFYPGHMLILCAIDAYV
jgi:hypothetical protein